MSHKTLFHILAVGSIVLLGWATVGDFIAGRWGWAAFWGALLVVQLGCTWITFWRPERLERRE